MIVFKDLYHLTSVSRRFSGENLHPKPSPPLIVCCKGQRFRLWGGGNLLTVPYCKKKANYTRAHSAHSTHSDLLAVQLAFEESSKFVISSVTSNISIPGNLDCNILWQIQ